MTDKHTPGPWYVAANDALGRRGQEHAHHTVHADNGVPVCRMGGNTTAHTDTRANARLIAAAPELLAALRAIKAAIEAPGSYRDTVNAVDRITQAAIAKATE